MEVINFKTKYEIGQKVYRVDKISGEVFPDTVRAVVFSHDPIEYVCGRSSHPEKSLFPTFDEAIAAAEPIWLNVQKKRCLPDYYDEL